MTQIFIGTNNQGKLIEFENAFKQLGLNFTNPQKQKLNANISETGKTFTENAMAKAKEWAKIAKLPTLVDDSGLCVDALDGKPGIYSARFVAGSDENRNYEILILLNNVPFEKRSAHYVCVIAFVDPQTKLKHISEGICKGHILTKPQGVGGFGYDPIFQPLGYKQSFGELPLEVKQKISHRAKALTLMLDYLKNWTKT